MTAQVRVSLPALLSDADGGERKFALAAPTLALAFAALAAARPLLAQRLFDEHGRLRQHVLCFVNGTNSRWIDTATAPLQDGDELLFMQAVSGG